MSLRILAPASAAIDVSAIEQRISDVQTMAEAAQAAGSNARGMVLARDPKLAALQAAADQLPISLADAEQEHEALSARIATLEAAPAPQRGETGAAGKSAYDLARDLGYGGTATQWLASLKGADGQSIKGDKGDTGDTGSAGAKGADGATGAAGTANLAVGAQPVGLLALNGFTTITVPLSRTMPNTTYSTALAHSAVVNLANVTLTVTAKTTTNVTVKVQSVGLGLAAGTLVCVAF